METWVQTIGEADADAESKLRRCTYAGRPCGSKGFLETMSARFGRSWVIGRPRKARSGGCDTDRGERQLMLVGE